MATASTSSHTAAAAAAAPLGSARLRSGLVAAARRDFVHARRALADLTQGAAAAAAEPHDLTPTTRNEQTDEERKAYKSLLWPLAPAPPSSVEPREHDGDGDDTHGVDELERRGAAAEADGAVSANTRGQDEYYERVKLETTLAHVRALIDAVDSEAAGETLSAAVPEMRHRLAELERAAAQRYKDVRRPELPNFQLEVDLPPIVRPEEMEPPAATVTHDGETALPAVAGASVLDRTRSRDGAGEADDGWGFEDLPEDAEAPEKPRAAEEEDKAGTAMLAKDVESTGAKATTTDVRRRRQQQRREGQEGASAPESSRQGVDNVLSHHRATQDELTGELGRMASALKSNTFAFQSALDKDKQVMGDAQDKLVGNDERMRSQRARLGQHRTKSRGTTCFIILVVSGVAAVWLFMFLLIKVT